MKNLVHFPVISLFLFIVTLISKDPLSRITDPTACEFQMQITQNDFSLSLAREVGSFSLFFEFCWENSDYRQEKKNKN